MSLKKIAYLVGAGATHAEILNLEESPSAIFIQRNGLLISSVSKRVMRDAQGIPSFKKNVESVTSPEGSLNIELLISLFASNQIPNSDSKVNKLKKLVQIDILKRLSMSRKLRFYLHKALLELHQKIDDRENLLGIISLNYDDIIDEAYKACQMEINYCHTSSDGGRVCSPLLKLHGSFNWTRKNNYGKKKDIPIIPLGLNKNYLVPPYNFIWSRAFEILTQCDTLRVIGCSLNQNDVGLIDLLFKAHLERTGYFEIEIIDWQNKGDEIKNNYGFFPGIIKPKDIENSLIADEQIINETGVGNPFKIWLKAKAQKMLQTMDEINKTKYLKKCF
jgi:hypothetical protein